MLTEINEQKAWCPNAFPGEKQHDALAYHAQIQIL